MIDEEAPLRERDLGFERSSRLKKAATAFRTISEVADDLHVPQHVLRFWETRFPQVKPLKRGGGRRYYRPDDVVLLRRISDLLYTQGYTIKGVQRLLIEDDETLIGALSPAEAAGASGFSERGDEPSEAEAMPPFSPDSSDRHPSADLSNAAEASDEVLALRRLLSELLDELEAIRRQIAL